MTNKEKIRKEVQRLQDLTMDENKNFYSEAAEGEYNALCNIEHFIDSLQEEPKPQFKVGDIIRSKVWELAVHEIVSMDDSAYFFENGGMVRFADQVLWELVEEPACELLNTESMIESYKQRLISQANGVKNSPLIDMCLASYKHGINETLDTLNLSKVQRIGKEWKEELVGKDLEKELPKVWDRETLDEYAYQVAYDLSNDWMRETPTWDDVETAVKLGAKWQENHLWKSAEGPDLPIFGREVIVLTQNYPLENSEYAVSFAHRPYKGKYIGKSLTTGNIETFEIKTYDKGGWNIPDVKFWLDCDFPKEKEE